MKIPAEMDVVKEMLGRMSKLPIKQKRLEDETIRNQEVMDSINLWADDDNMAWYDLKFKVIRIGNSNIIEDTKVFTRFYE